MDSVNRYRRTKGLKAIPTNTCLCRTAEAHARQLNKNQARKNDWKDCKYKENPNCMWKKPKEICGYQNKGFENWAGYENEEGSMTVKTAIDFWMKSPGTKSMILNTGNWKNIEWKGMGASVAGGYALLWFGD